VINKHVILSGRIRQELKEIELSSQRAKKAWEKALTSSDDLYLDGAALNIHDFYCGAERIFERITEIVDEAKFGGANWHKELLIQMSTEIPEIRPAVISEKTRNTLEEYRAFRHVVRNVYAHNFKAKRIANLIQNLDIVLHDLKVELQDFCGFLKDV